MKRVTKNWTMYLMCTDWIDDYSIGLLSPNGQALDNKRVEK
jgi:hypothetical protein